MDDLERIEIIEYIGQYQQQQLRICLRVFNQ